MARRVRNNQGNIKELNYKFGLALFCDKCTYF